MQANKIWNTLSVIDVNDHVEVKEGLKYLSWAWAWGVLQKHYPEASYEIHENEHGLPYFESNLGLLCKVSVTVEGITRQMMLPVMDPKNKAMKAEEYTYQVWDKYKKQQVSKKVNAATMFDINKTVMRCLVKCIAMFGLGHYLYAGEDLPEPETPEWVFNLRKWIEEEDHENAYVFSRKNEDLDLSPVWEKGRISKQKTTYQKLITKGFKEFSSLQETILEYINACDDAGIKEELTDCNEGIKQLIWQSLNSAQQSYMKEVFSGE